MSEKYFNLLKNYAGKNDNIRFNQDTFDKLTKFVEYVLTWGKTHNIISNKYTSDDVWNNIIDSVAGASFLNVVSSIYDVGSGGGFPGIILAILFNESAVNLIESNRKKCSFLRLLKNILNLKNVKIENQRVENFSNLEFITTKAAFSPEHINIVATALASGGKLALWATPKNKESFVKALESKQTYLARQFDYELLDNQQRCILIFTKN